MHPAHYAEVAPDKLACVLTETGVTMTYRALNEASNRAAHLFRELGLRRGDVIAAMLENELAVFEIAWAAQRAGLYFTSISTKLSTQDVAYIINDSGARIVIASDALAAQAAEALSSVPRVTGFCVSSASHGLRSWRQNSAELPTSPILDESPGTDMLYSSGTTGRPKGVKPPLPIGSIEDPTPLVGMGRSLYGMNEGMLYLSTSPLYHAAPLRWAMTAHRFGGTVFIMDRFDPEKTLCLIQNQKITHGTFVPTHFVRLLKLPQETRDRFNPAPLRAAIHAAAPCPIPVKRAMIDWWGPIIHEYYSGTESCGITALSSEEWLRKPGSVGKAVLGKIKIVDGAGELLPAGETGDVYFSDGPAFEYHNDPQKTASAYNSQGWATLGDIGYVDEDGYLFLTDRKSFMIISGGVNIYPQEIENVLITHPAVLDVAVIGVPDEEMGERVIAIVQLAAKATPSSDLAEALSAFARQALGKIKTPREFIFRDALPREATGKLMKRLLIDEFKERG